MTTEPMVTTVTDCDDHDQCDVLVVGSSVAYGQYATNNNSWVQQLAFMLKARYNKTLVNIAVPGYTTVYALRQLQIHIKIHGSRPRPPKYVIVSLSACNEGLGRCSTREIAQKFITHYLTHIHQLIKVIRCAGSTPIMCSVYPHQYYTALHKEVLYFIHDNMKKLDCIYIDFLSALDDGQGHWKPNMAHDAGHPNDNGHRAMFEAAYRKLSLSLSI